MSIAKHERKSHPLNVAERAAFDAWRFVRLVQDARVEEERRDLLSALEAVDAAVRAFKAKLVASEGGAL